MSYLLKYKLLQAYYKIPEFIPERKDNYFKISFNLGTLMDEVSNVPNGLNEYNIEIYNDIVTSNDSSYWGAINESSHFYYSIGTRIYNSFKNEYDESTGKWERFNGKITIPLARCEGSNYGGTFVYFIGDGSDRINLKIEGKPSEYLLDNLKNGHAGEWYPKGKLRQEDINLYGHLSSLYYGNDTSKYDYKSPNYNVTLQNNNITIGTNFATNYNVEGLFSKTDNTTENYGLPGNVKDFINRLNIGTNDSDINNSKNYKDVFKGLKINTAYVSNIYILPYEYNSKEAFYNGFKTVEYSNGTEAFLKTPEDFYTYLYGITDSIGNKTWASITNGIYLDLITYYKNIDKNINEVDALTLSYEEQNILNSNDRSSIETKLKNMYKVLDGMASYVNTPGIQDVIKSINKYVNDAKNNGEFITPYLNIEGCLPSLDIIKHNNAKITLENGKEVSLEDGFEKIFIALDYNNLLSSNDWNIYIKSKIWKGNYITIYFAENSRQSTNKYLVHPVKISNLTGSDITFKDLLGKITFNHYSRDYSLCRSYSEMYVGNKYGYGNGAYLDNEKQYIFCFYTEKNPNSYGYTPAIQYGNNDDRQNVNKLICNYIYYKGKKSSDNTPYNIYATPDLVLENGMIFYINTDADTDYVTTDYIAQDNNTRYIDLSNDENFGVNSIEVSSNISNGNYKFNSYDYTFASTISFTLLPKEKSSTE